MYAWFQRFDHTVPPEGFLQSLETIAQVLKLHGPFDGVIGFSQGSIMAGMVASLLEGPSRKRAFDAACAKYPYAMPYPQSFLGLDHPPLKFGVTYGGLIGEGRCYKAFYENPPIQTAFCHFVGEWDPIIDRQSTQTLIRTISGAGPSFVVVHPGAHHVPTTTRYLEILLAFIDHIARDAARDRKYLPSGKRADFVLTRDVEERLGRYL